MHSSIAGHCDFEQRMNDWRFTCFLYNLILMVTGSSLRRNFACSPECMLCFLVMVNLYKLLYFERIVPLRSDGGEVVLTFDESRRVDLNFVNGR